MLKSALSFGVFCIFLWSFEDIQSQCKDKNEYCEIRKRSTGENKYFCTLLHQKEVIAELTMLTKDDILAVNAIHLQLDGIKFNSKSNRMSKGWLDIPELFVKWLRLENIHIEIIENDAFNSVSFMPLERLKIINIPLKTLKKNTFNGLIFLKELDLRGLRLSSIQEHALMPMFNLTSIWLSNCGTEKIYLDNLFGSNELHNLRKVGVSNCYLKDTITNRTFSGLSNVVSLTLASNSIEKIGPNSFDRMIAVKSLKLLYLQSNELKSLPEHIFGKKLEFWIDLRLNPWHCDCRMEHLRLFIQNATNLNFIGLVCETPKIYQGVFLKDCPYLCDGDTTAIVPVKDSVSTISHIMLKDTWLYEEKPTETDEHKLDETVKLSVPPANKIPSKEINTISDESKTSNDEETEIDKIKMLSNAMDTPKLAILFLNSHFAANIPLEQLNNKHNLNRKKSFMEMPIGQEGKPMASTTTPDDTGEKPTDDTGGRSTTDNRTELPTNRPSSGSMEVTTVNLITLIHEINESTPVTTEQVETESPIDVDEDSLIIIYVLLGILAFFIVSLVCSILIKLVLKKVRTSKSNELSESNVQRDGVPGRTEVAL